MQQAHIVGRGSIALLLANALNRAGLQTTLLLADSSTSQSQTCTYEPRWAEGEDACAQQKFACALEPASAPGAASMLLVATKGNDALRAVQSVQHRLGAGSSVVLIQNGVLAVYQELWAGLLQRMAHRPRVIVGSITHGAYMHPDGQYHVVHAGRGGATWAEVDPALPCLTHPGHSRMWAQPRSPAMDTLLSLDWFNNGPAEAAAAASHAGFLRAIWLKLGVNCAINPSTAILGCRNGALLEPHATAAMRDVCTEVAAVLGPGAPTGPELLEAALQVAAVTAGNRSSMLQDVANGRATEIDYLNGFIVRQGQARQVPTPANQLLCHMVKAKLAGVQQQQVQPQQPQP